MKKRSFALCLLLSSAVVSASDTGTAKIVGDAAAGKEKTAVCAGCHGVDGNSIAPTFPNLAGQHIDYLAKEMGYFKDGSRKNAIMAPMVAALSDQDMADLAAYYAQQTGKVGSIDAATVAGGEKIYRGGNAETGVAACMACHGPSGKGNPQANMPKLSGQQSAYVLDRLKRFKLGDHSGNSNSQIMEDVAKRMSESEMQAVANYVSALH